MTFLPIVERELRASARQSFTYSLRALGVAASLLTCLVFALQYGFGPTLGGRLFGSLHFTLFWAIWVLVPLLTADCISRERREGTLGLLFLSRLRATDIVVAKALAHALRALTLLLAVLPVLTIPFLLGGVNWTEALLLATVNFSSICWALAAGLLASACSKSWLRSVLGAYLLAIFILVVFGLVAGQIMLRGTSGAPGPRSWQTNSDFVLLIGYGVLMGSTRYIRSMFTPSTGQLLWAMGLLTGFSLVGLMLAILLAGRRTQRVWQEPPPSRVRLLLQRTFCTPMFWLSFFRRWMLRKLERNPIGWLEQRTWTGRLVTWGWLAVIVSIYSAVLTDRNFFRDSSTIQNTMSSLLGGSLAMSAAGSFRRERESSMMELLLVSPLSEGKIIFGRLRGLWGQFLPAFGLLLGVWAYSSNLVPDFEDGGKVLFHAIAFLTLPVIGLYFSLRCRNFIAAFVLTLAVGFLSPILLAALFRLLRWIYGDFNSFASWQMWPSVDSTAIQIILAALCGRALLWRLKHRAFPFARD